MTANRSYLLALLASLAFHGTLVVLLVAVLHGASPVLSARSAAAQPLTLVVSAPAESAAAGSTKSVARPITRPTVARAQPRAAKPASALPLLQRAAPAGPGAQAPVAEGALRTVDSAAAAPDAPPKAAARPASSTAYGAVERGRDLHGPVAAGESAPPAARGGAAPLRRAGSAAPPGAGAASGSGVESQRLHAAELARALRPTYPLEARRRGWQGLTVIRLELSSSGRVISASVAASSGHEVLDGAALDAARAARFLPARRGGRPVASTVLLPIRFRLTAADR